MYKVKLLSFSWGSVVSISVLIWFIRYIYYRNVQFLSNVIITKSKVLPPSPFAPLPPSRDRSHITQLWLSCLVGLVDFHRLLNYLFFQFFDNKRTWWRHSLNASCTLSSISTSLLLNFFFSKLTTFHLPHKGDNSSVNHQQWTSRLLRRYRKKNAELHGALIRTLPTY